MLEFVRAMAFATEEARCCAFTLDTVRLRNGLFPGVLLVLLLLLLVAVSFAAELLLELIEELRAAATEEVDLTTGIFLLFCFEMFLDFEKGKRKNNTCIFLF